MISRPNSLLLLIIDGFGISAKDVFLIRHTGMLDSAIKAGEVVDTCFEQIVNAIKQVAGQALLTAVLGSIVQLIDLIISIVGHKPLLEAGKLADLAPIMLQTLGVSKPKEMAGRFLI